MAAAPSIRVEQRPLEQAPMLGGQPGVPSAEVAFDKEQLDEDFADEDEVVIDDI